MLSKRTGIILAIVLAAALTALIVYGLGIAGDEATDVENVVQP